MCKKEEPWRTISLLCLHFFKLKKRNYSPFSNGFLHNAIAQMFLANSTFFIEDKKPLFKQVVGKR
jgi:hypothetical protein